MIVLALLLVACGEDPPPPSPVRTVEPAEVEPAEPAPPACPEEADGVRVTPEGLTVAAPIRFDLYAGTIAPETLHAVDAVARRLGACPELRVEIQVHTDAMRMSSFNARQSQVIADAVRARLIEQGVDGARLAACGYGESRPIAPSTTVEDRERNMRIEWHRIADAAAHACPDAATL